MHKSSTRTRTTPWAALAVVLLVAGSARFTHLDALRLHWTGTNLFSIPRGDAAFHWNEAQVILSEDFLLQDRIPWKGPGYSYFLAALRALVGSDLGDVRWVLALLGMANCVGITLFARRLLPSAWAAVAGVLCALNGTIILFDSEPLFPTLLITLNLVVFWQLGKSRTSAWNLMVAGFAMGVSALVHPVYLIPGLFLAVSSGLSQVRAGALFALGIVLAVLPISLQNLIQRGQPILISWSGGINLYVGNQPGFDQLSGQGTAAWGRVLKTTLAAGIEDEARRDAVYYGLAADQVREDPFKTAAILLEKLRVLLSPVEISNNLQLYELRDYSWPLRVLMGHTGWLWWPAGIWIPAALLGALSVFRQREQEEDSVQRSWSLLAFWSGGLILTILLSFNTARYRAPLIFFASLPIAYWLHGIRLRFGRDGWTGLVRPISEYALVVAIVASLARPQTALPAPAEWSQARYLEQVDPRLAQGWYEQALRRDPDSAPLQLSVSNFFGRTGQPKLQMALLERITSDPTLEPDLLALAHEGMARAQIALGNPAAARRSVLAALALRVDHCSWRGEPYFQMGLVPSSECKFRLLLAGIELLLGNDAEADLQVRLVRAGCPAAKIYAGEIAQIEAQIGRDP